MRYTSTPPRSLMGKWRYTKTRPKTLEGRRREAFCQYVRELLVSGHMENAQFAQLNTFPNKMNVQLDVFRALVMYQI